MYDPNNTCIHIPFAGIVRYSVITKQSLVTKGSPTCWLHTGHSEDVLGLKWAAPSWMLNLIPTSFFRISCCCSIDSKDMDDVDLQVAKSLLPLVCDEVFDNKACSHSCRACGGLSSCARYSARSTCLQLEFPYLHEAQVIVAPSRQTIPMESSNIIQAASPFRRLMTSSSSYIL